MMSPAVFFAKWGFQKPKPFTDRYAAFRFAEVPTKPLPLRPPSLPFLPEKMDLHWVVPDFVAGAGGHATIFRIVKLLEERGHRATIWINGKTLHGTATKAREFLRREYFPLAAEVKLLSDMSAASEITADAVIATDRWSAYPACFVTRVRQRFYFVQDFEPLFYPMGAEYLLTEATYSFGFTFITAGSWLKRKMSTYAAGEVYTFDLAYDPSIYYDDPAIQRQEDHIAFYARHQTPRRAVELGLFALELLGKRRPQLTVDFFGADIGKLKTSYRYHDHGIIHPTLLSALYRKSTLGMVFSTTNYSLIPNEMMACGLPVVDLASDSTRSAFPSGVVTLSSPMPWDLAWSLDTLLSDASLRAKQVESAKRYLRNLSWQKSADQVESALKQALLERLQC